jgi:SAM-dependent methyltransferase
MSLAEHPDTRVETRVVIDENPSVFDAVAGDYDADFTGTRLGRMLRQRVWRLLGLHFAAGDHVLELACGTGEDAVWLAKRGIRVTATDASAEMTRIAGDKAVRNGVAGLVSVQRCSLEQLADGEPVARSGWRVAGGGQPSADLLLYDGAFSNFGGLNTVGDWRPLAKALAGMVRDGGKVILVPMGPFCPWEVGWHLAHGRPKMAVRRFGGRATAEVGRGSISLWYPTAARLRRDFGPWFRYLGTESLGLWLPPTYLGHLVERWPGLFSRLDRLEAATARYGGGWGDHFVIVLERKGQFESNGPR